MPYKVPEKYCVWQAMKQRCLNPKNHAYKYYGGRGIGVCNEWMHNFSQFCEDMGPRPKGYSLDRIDNSLGYSPDNCRWAGNKTQQRNQRWTRFVDIDGLTYKAVELAESAGVKTDTIVNRANKGMSLDQVTSKTVKFIPSSEHIAKAVSGNKRRTDAQTHCKNGHEYTEKNTYITKEGWRNCRHCHKEREIKRRAGKLNA